MSVNASGNGRLQLLLGLVLVLAACVRLYALDTPSMWWDEILSAMISAKTPAYIWDWSKTQEVHPPLFYLLVKLVSVFGVSDFALRLPSVVFGVAHVWACYWLMRRWLGSQEAALVAAALVAACPLHILLSRQVRPYPELMCLWALGLALLRAWVEKPTGARLAALCAINTVLGMLHFLGLLLFGAQALFVAGLHLASPRRRSLPRLAAFGLVLAAGALPSLYFYAHTMVGRGDMAAAVGQAEVLGRLALCFSWLVQSFGADVPIDWIGLRPTLKDALVGLLALFGLCLPGAVVCWRKDKAMTALLAAYMLVPLAVLVVGGQGFMRSRHIFLFYLPMFFFAAAGLWAWIARLAPNNKAVLAVLPLLPLLTAFPKAGALYGPASYPDKYALEATALAAMTSPGEPVFFPEDGLYNALGWYAGRGGPNPFGQGRAEGEGRRVLHYITPSRLDTLPQSEMDFIRPLGAPSQVRMAYDMPVLTWTASAKPVHQVQSLPARLHVAPTPADLCLRSYSMSSMVAFSGNGSQGAASANGRQAKVVYALEGPLQGASVRALVKHRNQGAGNRLTLSLGDQPGRPRVLAQSLGPDLSAETLVFSGPGWPARSVFVELGLTTTDTTPGYPGGNLMTNFYEALDVAAFRSDSALRGRILSAGLSGVGEQEAAGGVQYRWLLGPVATVRFVSAQDGPLDMVLEHNSLVAGQVVEVELNGSRVGVIEDTAPQARLVEWRSYSLALAAKAGENTLRLVSRRFNRNPSGAAEETFAPEDPRPLSLLLGRFSLGSGELIAPGGDKPGPDE